MNPAPRYRVQLWSMDATDYGPDVLLADFENAKNIGWSGWLNEVSSAFVTLDADDPKLAAVRAYKGRAHMRIYRNDDLVWGGWWLENDSNERDCILYGYSYLAGLYWSLTDWGTEYDDSQIDTIVSAQWTRAKTTLSDSMLNWVATGTIEAPVTTSGGSTAIVLPFYQVFFKRALLVMQELAGLGASDTTNAVWFEITPSGTFNFWKNKQTDQSEVLWEYGGNVAGYSEQTFESAYRNVLEGVGASPDDPTLRVEKTGSSLATWGRRMEPVFYSYVRDATEIDRVTSLRLALAERASGAISLRFSPNEIVPPGATDATFALADRVKVKINRGLTNIDDYFRVTGVQVLFLRGNEYVRARVQERPGE